MNPMDQNIPRPPQAPQKIPAPTPPGKTNYVPATASSSTLLLIRTMKSDVAIAIKQQNESLVSIALAAEKQKAAREQIKIAEKTASEQTHPTHKRRRVFIVLGIAIILVGMGGGGVLLWPKISTLTFLLPNFEKPTAQEEIPPPVKTTPQPLAPSLAPAQSEKRLTLDKNNLQGVFSVVDGERTAGLAPNEIRNIYFIEAGALIEGGATAMLSARQFFSTIGALLPDILSRSLEAPFMIGLLGESGNIATPFVILTVSNSNSALAGMLAWESGLPKFFNKFFGTTIPEVSTGKSRVGKFRDTITWNHDARIFESTNGTVSYTFANSKIIIIASSKSALETLLPLFHKTTGSSDNSH